MAFIVVHFLETDEVAIISQSWLVDENLCKWPPYENRLLIKRALLEKRVPDNDWNDREIFVMAVHDTYAKAKKEVDIALRTDSDSEGKTSERESKKQKLQTVLRSTPPPAPDIIVKNEMIRLDPCSPTRIFIPYQSLLSTPICSEHVKKVPCSSCRSSASVVNRDLSNNILSDNLTNQAPLSSSPSEVRAVFSTIPSDPISVNQDPSPKKICCSSEAKLDTLEKQLKSMEATLTYISNVVKELKEKPTLYASITNGNSDFNRTASPPVIFSRIQTIEEMISFNDSLSNTTLFSELVKYFGFMGGRDTSEATRKILTKLMSNDLAKEMNWIGNVRKKSFQEFQSVIQLIVAAVRQNKGFKEVTLFEVEGFIARWLRYSSDREGGRSKRKKKDDTDVETEGVKTRRMFEDKETEEDTNTS